MSAQRLKHTLAAVTLFATLAAAPSVFAHAHLESQLPAADSTVPAVKELRLNFSEGVEEKFTKISITSTVGGKTEVEATANVSTDPNDKKVLIVTPAAPLGAGEYKIEWHAVSVDTHKSEGSYSFTVAP
jgi:methionine-rich copper-binding protein CopC